MKSKTNITVGEQVYATYEGTKIFGKVLEVKEFCVTINAGNNFHPVLDRDTVKKLG